MLKALHKGLIGNKLSQVMGSPYDVANNCEYADFPLCCSSLKADEIASNSQGANRIVSVRTEH